MKQGGFRDPEDSSFDEDRCAPRKYSFSINGYRLRYHLTALMPYYGEEFCQRFESAWRKAAAFHVGSTSNNYFKAARSAFLHIARMGAVKPNSAQGEVLRGFRDNPTWSPNTQVWSVILDDLSTAITTLQDNSFIQSGSPASRNKKFENLRCALRWLAIDKLVPDVELVGKRLPEEYADASECLATVKYKAGRLDLSGLNLREASDKFASCNREVLEELRKQLWLELKENVDLFKYGQELISDPALPDIFEIECLLASHSRYSIRCKKIHQTLGLTEKQLLGLALKIFKHRSIAANSISLTAIEFARTIIRNDEAQPYYEATINSLNAAYHIILIDLGANCQPVDDIPFDCYLHKQRRGKIQVRSVQLVKNRSMGKVVPGALKEDDLLLPTKSIQDRPSGVAVIEIWKELTATMRSQAGLTAERLWVWRRAGWAKPRTALTSMSSLRWPSFLARHVENDIFGGLAIDRRQIRTTVRNTRAEGGYLDIAVERALMGHSHPKTSFEYLSEGATRSLLESQIREFLEAWEAVNIHSIDQAALMLGIPEKELFRRKQLGIDNGLGILCGSSNKSLHESHSTIPLLSHAAQELSISATSMRDLELARRALRQQFMSMVHVNPQRLVRKWVSWMAIVEGYCHRLECSRFRLEFSKICNNVDQQLLEGRLRIPLLW